MIAVDNRPFSVVSDVGFTRLMNYIELRYCIPSRTYFSEKMIPQLFDRLQTVVHQFLDEQEYVSCTTDIWSTPSQDSLLSLTAHFLTPTFERKQVILQAVKFNESHTGADIATLINSCILRLIEQKTALLAAGAESAC